MQVFAVKIINIMLAVSLVCTYNAVVNDRKEHETAARQKLAEQQAQAAEENAAPASPYADGTYTGEAQGYGGPVKMEVTIEHGQITDCTVLSAEKEDTAYFDAAQGVIDEVLDEQTAEVDTVSGATFSSGAFWVLWKMHWSRQRRCSMNKSFHSQKGTCLCAGSHSGIVLPLSALGIYHSLFRHQVRSDTDRHWLSRGDEFVSHCAAGTVCVYRGVRQILLRLRLCVRYTGRCGACSVSVSL